MSVEETRSVPPLLPRRGCPATRARGSKSDTEPLLVTHRGRAVRSEGEVQERVLQQDFKDYTILFCRHRSREVTCSTVTNGPSDRGSPGDGTKTTVLLDGAGVPYGWS